MKIRSGFVSNSSSSSFVLQKKRYSKDELKLILNPQKYIEKIKDVKVRQLIEDGDTREEAEESVNMYEAFENVEDVSMWEVHNGVSEIKFFTVMDNFLWDEYIEVVQSLSKEDIEKVLGDDKDEDRDS